MNTTKSKIHHIVPQCYLKNFTFNNEQLYVFSKIKNKKFVSHVHNVACRNYFYDIPALESEFNKDRQIVEKLLSSIDTKFCTTIKKIIDDIEKCKFFDPILKDELSPMIFIQATRTATFRVGSKIGAKSFIEKNINKSSDFVNLTEREQEKIFNQYVCSLQAQLMLDPVQLENFQSKFRNFIWYIGINNTQHPFITSDTPVIRIRHENHSADLDIKYFKKNTQWAFPLTSKYLLIMLDQNYFKEHQKVDCQAGNIDEREIKFYNDSQIVGNNLQVLSMIDNLDEIEKIYISGSNMVKSNISIKIV